MEYEQLLDEAYESVVSNEACERFEIIGVRGHHAGTKTIILNFGKVAACIRRQPVHIIKFLNKELASSAELSGDKLTFSRRLSSRDVNEKIGKYVNRFVTCPQCRKPDTELNDEGNKLFLRCLACGNKQEIHKI